MTAASMIIEGTYCTLYYISFPLSVNLFYPNAFQLTDHSHSFYQINGVRLLPSQPQPPLHPGTQHSPTCRPPRQGPPQRSSPDPVTGPGPQAGKPAARTSRGCSGGATCSLSGQDPIRTRSPGWWRSNG